MNANQINPAEENNSPLQNLDEWENDVLERYPDPSTINQDKKEEEFRSNLSIALKALSPKQIELIRLKFFENLSYKEIADISSQSIKTSYNTIYDAIKILRLKLRM